MYKCHYCKIFLSHPNFTICNQHELGNRHKLNKAFFFQNLCLKFLVKIIFRILIVYRF
ncbi:hypothetical protein CMESO_235 (nucleomorph) [Chroomonas mesostigmatica CCMP1168]|uniref:U1-C C2H2-type zinc finger domain-containing protein n=1 Tax=Chroomonas mesostigmatica CCMP1168 TaxID=1195612 RepID=J7G7Y2_9CRYP|nr:hypothetical protein CMESO_235 [Chroomonas mesostigmatica CCMP1168]